MRKKAKPPAANPASLANRFLIGKNSRGAWVVKDKFGLRSGLFVDRAEALRFALFDNGRPNVVVMVPEGLELDEGPELDMGRVTEAAP